MSEAQSFLQHHKLTVQDYETQITDSHVERISRSYCKRWKLLPPYLKMETIVAEDIDCKQAHEGEKRYEFIKTWKQEKGSKATYLSLISALLQIDCKDDAGNVCKLLYDEKRILATSTVSTQTAPGSGIAIAYYIDFACMQRSRNGGSSARGYTPPPPQTLVQLSDSCA